MSDEPSARVVDRSRALLAVGPLAALGLAGALVPLRDQVANANVALALAMVVVAVAALGGRAPAATTSVSAALAFNVLHTRPYLSLKIDSRADMISTGLLLVMGAVAGLVTESGWRHRERALVRSEQLDRICRIAELAVAADDLTAVWPTVRDTLRQELHLGSCWFEPEPSGAGDAADGVQFPELTHRGTVAPSREPFRVSAAGGYELPPNGVELAVTGGGTRLGRLVMLPEPGHAFSLVDRRFAVAIADQFALVAARSSHRPPLW